MLVNPPLETLLPKTENRYTLAILVAKRARQLVDGALPLTQSESPNLVTVASEELGDDRIFCVQGQASPHIPLRPEVEAARLAAEQAVAQAELAETVREELERSAAIAAEPMDASDVRILSEALMNQAVEQADETLQEEAADQAPQADSPSETDEQEDAN